MIQNSLKDKIKYVRSSIVAIGFQPDPERITIIGSGFSIGEGRIMTAAHLYNHLEEGPKEGLKANVMVEQGANDDEKYKWMDIQLVSKDDKHDVAILQFKDSESELLEVLEKNELELGDSDKIEVGQDTYFIGFPYAAALMNEGFGVTLVVNKGTISNVKRDGTDPTRAKNWFIVDAISNPGNSGCPLIDIETNQVIGVMTVAFRTKSKTFENLDIREPMHIAGARPINSVKYLFT